MKIPQGPFTEGTLWQYCQGEKRKKLLTNNGNDTLSRKGGTVIRILTLLCFLILLSVFAEICLAETELFKLKNRLAAEVLPVVEVFLSPDGSAVADSFGNMIVVNDTPEVIDEIRVLLLTSDRPVAQVKVQIALDAADNDEIASFGKNGKRGRYLSTEEPHFRYSDAQQTGKKRSFILVSSGSSGYIRMARQVLVTEEWHFLFRRHGMPIFFKGIRTIETGMEVSPVVVGDQVVVTVTPRISWLANGDAENFRFVDASTTISVPHSEWVEFGGVNSLVERDSDILGTILASGDFSEKSSILMKIKADVNLNQ